MMHSNVSRDGQAIIRSLEMAGLSYSFLLSKNQKKYKQLHRSWQLGWLELGKQHRGRVLATGHRNLDDDIIKHDNSRPKLLQKLGPTETDQTAGWMSSQVNLTRSPFAISVPRFQSAELRMMFEELCWACYSRHARQLGNPSILDREMRR